MRILYWAIGLMILIVLEWIAKEFFYFFGHFETKLQCHALNCKKPLNATKQKGNLTIF